MSYIPRHPRPPGRHLVRLAAAAAATTSMLSACGGSDGSSEPVATVSVAADSVDLIGPSAFADYIDDNPDVPVVNVHIPYEGHIDGTDSFIAFDSILQSDELPSDMTAPIALYCRSGNMSAQAASDLADAGYTNVIDLDGGMNAWDAAGYALVEDPSAAGDG